MLKALLLGLISFYRKGISPLTPPSCRFSPTCSAYAEQAIGRFGPVRGTWLAVRRILRCHPFGGSGFDPVPEGMGDKAVLGRSERRASVGDRVAAENGR
jgi:putative membrane protein insertion efficiency factor